jgi:hypothetical protein
MKKILLSLLLIPAAAFAADNQTTTCTRNGEQRIIEVASAGPGCEVHYTKGTDTKTLWSSARAEYCTEQAAAFVEKQKGWGFECEAKAAAENAAAQ